MSKKCSFLALVLFLLIRSYGQQEPRWMMPLYFEDAAGAKDTVYIGYDSRASNQVADIDSIFDEGWIRIDTTRFNVFFWIYPGYSPGGYYRLITDSVRVKDISSWPYPYASIGFTNGKMPLVVKWEDTLLNSPNLPFPDINPRPRARIDLSCEGSEPNFYNCPIEYDPLSLTGYVTDDLLYPVTDSLVFYGSGDYSAYEAIFNVQVQIVPHDYHYTGTSKINDDKEFFVYPNPFYDQFTITNLTSSKLVISLFNSVGQKVFQTKSSQSLISININNLKGGVYFLKISTSKKSITNKLLKIN